MAQYAKFFADKDKVFIDLTDSMTRYYQRLKDVSGGLHKILALEEYHKHKIYEPAICKKYTNIIICSQDDKEYLINNLNCEKNKFYILENGVNINEWTYKQEIMKKHFNNLVFWGVMNVETNFLSCKFFIREVMPLLSDSTSFSIIGPKPSKRITQFANERIKFIGYVDNIQSALCNMGIFVCPIVSGAGVKNKIIQASLIGMPIVSTSLGAEGLNNELKKFIFIADKPQDFVRKINQILNMDKNKLEDLQMRQMEISRKYYNIYNIVKKFSKEI
jgi:glycosyltransferase involved in cell wall biosynthesis